MTGDRLSDEINLNEVSKQGTAELLLQNLAVPVDEVTARHQCREQNVDKASITEVREWKGAELLQDRRWLS